MSIRRGKAQSNELLNSIFGELEIVKWNWEHHRRIIRVCQDLRRTPFVCRRLTHWSWPHSACIVGENQLANIAGHISLSEKFRIWRLFVIKFLNLGSDWVLFHKGIINCHFDHWRIDKCLICWNKVWIALLQSKHITWVEYCVARCRINSLIQRSHIVLPALLLYVIPHITEKLCFFIICVSI